MLQKFSISNCMLFFWTFSSAKNKTYHGFHKNIKQHNCFNIDNNKQHWAANQLIRMISEASCDTEELSKIEIDLK